MPPAIQQALTGYFDPGLMDRVRLRIDDESQIKIAKEFAEPYATTLVDVIIFKGLAEASSPSLWAHQMVHVKQFMELGVSGFVIRYFSNRREIEDPAYAFEAEYVRRTGRGPQVGIEQSPVSPPLAICATPAGSCLPFTPTLQGMPCGYGSGAIGGSAR